MTPQEENKKKELDFYSVICQILNNLEDDLKLDLKEGENGYKTYEDSHNAVKKYTLKLVKKQERKMRLKRKEQSK